MVNNADWLNSLNYIDFLRDVGRHFSVNRMLTLRLGQAAARPRAGAVVSRIQLHDPAGLRLRRTAQAHRLRAADGRLRPVGQHRQRHRSRPAHAERAAVRADLAADHHRRRAPRWARPRPARSGSTPTWSAPTTTGSTGATPRTPTSRASSSCSPCCRCDEIDRLAALKGAEINEAKKMLATEATALVHGRAAAEQAAETARSARSRRRDLAERCRPLCSASATSRPASASLLRS